MVLAGVLVIDRPPDRFPARSYFFFFSFSVLFFSLLEDSVTVPYNGGSRDGV